MWLGSTPARQLGGSQPSGFLGGGFNVERTSQSFDRGRDSPGKHCTGKKLEALVDERNPAPVGMDETL